MASTGYKHCANCIGTLSFPIAYYTAFTGKSIEASVPTERVRVNSVILRTSIN